jgi:hypothetical protein
MRAFRREAGIGLQFVGRFDWHDFAMAPRTNQIEGGVDGGPV